MHWFEELLSRIIESVDKNEVVCSAGLSVSGLQHVGRLRGEVILPNTVANKLREMGRTVTQYLVLYTQDSWKGKESQIEMFKKADGTAYSNMRLIDVPDPRGCCKNWVDHFWRDFGEYLSGFANDVKAVTTTELYERTEMRTIVLDVVNRKSEVREIVNRYRGERKYSEDWIPFEPFCINCGKIGLATPFDANVDETFYKCTCGYEGTSPTQLGKLNWRLEWPAIWKLLEVDIEPFGKDHATPGGSRDSCIEIADKIFGIRAPFGIAYEWVGQSKRGKDLGDMSSSGFKGFTPRQWVEVAEPEILRYIYMRTDIAKRVVLDLEKMDIYYDNFDKATRSHFKKDRDDEEELEAFSWNLAVKDGKEPHFTLAYRHAALLSQILPSENKVEWAVNRLKDTGLIKEEPSQDDIDGLRTRLALAKKWVETYAPEYRVKLLESLPDGIKSNFRNEDKTAMGIFMDALSDVDWSEESIKDIMVELTKSGRLGIETKRFFKVFYMTFLGSEKGPRAAPFISILDKGFVIERLKEVAS